MNKKKKNDKLDKLLKKYEDEYMARKGADIEVKPKIRTGIFALDYVLDGGISQDLGGHMIEFFGGESSAKTATSLKIVAQFQKLGKMCVFLDAENSYSPTWGEILGIDNDNLLVLKPATLEKAGDLIKELLGEVDLIVIDSITALVPNAELGRDLENKTMASQAAVNSPMCRQLNRIRNKTNTSIIFINQLREKVGQMFGNPETTSGGRALKHFYDTRVYFKQAKPIDIGSGDNKQRIGFELDMWCKKNKKGKPYKRQKVDFYFNGHYADKKNILFAAIKFGVIDQAGAWFTYGDIKEQGKEKLEEAIKDWDKLQSEVWERMKK